MNPASLDPAEFQKLIERFATSVPTLLAENRCTADLARSIGALFAPLESPFTIAIVGQMRAGKSSLINALVGADLAVTGVNETTATINWFRHAPKERTRFFRAVWRDRPAEDFPLEEISQWVGDSNKAKATRHLDFFSDAPFLKKANLVDTPGTRSVLGDHTRATEEFLAIRSERETQEAGNAADAVIYVLPPVAREADTSLLGDFERSTRIPGSTPYNSMAVIHKWETQESKDPYGNALRKCDTVRKALGSLVSVVIPVSAPMGWSVEHYGDIFWQRVFDLREKTPPEVLEDLTLSEKSFTEWDEPACFLPACGRKQLRQDYRMPWASFKTIIAMAAIDKPATPGELKNLIAEKSGLNHLRKVLDTRFLARARLIKAFGVLSKGLEVATRAAARLRNHRQRMKQRTERAKKAMALLQEMVKNGQKILIPSLRFIRSSKQSAIKSSKKGHQSLKRIDSIALDARDAFGELDGDMKMLMLMDEEKTGFHAGWEPILRSLFGSGGHGVSNRIELLGNSVEAIEEAIGKLQKETVASSGNRKKIFEHARSRLETIADWLDFQDKATNT